MSRPGTGPSEPERLVSGDASDPALARLGELARDVPLPHALPDAALERVFRRLTRSPARFGGFGARRLYVVLAVLVVASAAVGRLALTRKSEGTRPPALVAPPPRATVVAPVRLEAPLPVTSALPAPVAPTPVAGRAAVATPVAPSANPESQLAAESKALEPAIGALRRERDAARALTLLGSYESSFPHGVLSLEARVLRVDALLALGRRADALPVLDALPLDRVGRGVELRLVRAELRAASDCRSALPDFDRVLSAAPAPSLDERALRGRALCRASSGDAAGARSDAERYLARYPAGRFAAELRGATF